MTRLFKLHTFFGAPLIIAAIAFVAACSQPEPPRERAIKPVRILEIGDSPIPMREFFGTAEASQTATLTFRFGGQVTEVTVLAGDRVDAGATIARLDSREWETQEKLVASELDTARAVLQQMRRGAREEDVQRLEAIVTARMAEADEAVAQNDRIERLFAESVVSSSERDRARLSMAIAQSAAESAELELRIARAGARPEELEAKEATIRGLESRLQEARDNLQDTVLRAPFAGIVSQVNISAFETVQANQPVVTLQNLGQIDVVIRVSEADFARGQRTQSDPEFRTRTVGFAEFPALLNRRFPLRIKEYQTQADSTTQTYRVVLQLDQDPTMPVKPGMNAIVRGEGTATGADVGTYLIPLTAVWGDPQGQRSVWIVNPDNSKVTRRPVTTGEVVGDSIVITTGLEAGEHIAVTAVNLLREGMQVEPMQDLGAL